MEKRYFYFKKMDFVGFVIVKIIVQKTKVKLGSFTRMVLGKQPQDAFSFDISMGLNGCNFFSNRVRLLRVGKRTEGIDEKSL